MKNVNVYIFGVFGACVQIFFLFLFLIGRLYLSLSLSLWWNHFNFIRFWLMIYDSVKRWNRQIKIVENCYSHQMKTKKKWTTKAIIFQAYTDRNKRGTLIITYYVHRLHLICSSSSSNCNNSSSINERTFGPSDRDEFSRDLLIASSDRNGWWGCIPFRLEISLFLSHSLSLSLLSFLESCEIFSAFSHHQPRVAHCKSHQNHFTSSPLWLSHQHIWQWQNWTEPKTDEQQQQQ